MSLFWIGMGLAFSPDGTILAVSHRDAVSFWETATRKEIARVPFDSYAIRCLAFSPDGKTLSAGLVHGDIAYWDLDRLLPPKRDRGRK